MFAWGDQGHEVVGIIAYARLAPTAKKNIDALLATDTDDLTAADFVSRTTWADKYRDSDRNTTRIRYLATREWHFVDIEIGEGKIDAPCYFYPKLPAGVPASAGPAKACLIDKINQFAAELINPKTEQKERQVALKYLLHLIGDLHQPLHTASNHDRGGNAVPVLFADHSKAANLHAYWDHHIVESLGDDRQALGKWLNKQVSLAQSEAWTKGSTIDWAMDSFGQAKRVVYDFNRKHHKLDDQGLSANYLDHSYNQRALPLVREQLSKAGVRLAAILNKIFQ